MSAGRFYVVGDSLESHPFLHCSLSSVDGGRFIDQTSSLTFPPKSLQKVPQDGVAIKGRWESAQSCEWGSEGDDLNQKGFLGLVPHRLRINRSVTVAGKSAKSPGQKKREILP
ncbi:hypothetical protein CEXT_72821 [Caerostris extrusa]|uniref:Uncharacterized protein n=1 Tax=Caerostris extrusa TaxID=172846 RepID=A0AAV4TNB2_CAEEX|nr:hypothetical protein CEXT_72821 [Caerostris extrusa]